MTTEANQNLVVSRIKAFGGEMFLACDGRCEKAWGISNRPQINFDEDDVDDIAYLSDAETGNAPLNPGTYEGGYGKPLRPQHNKWCFRECERSASCELGQIPVLPDFSARSYNQPWKHRSDSKPTN